MSTATLIRLAKQWNNCQTVSNRNRFLYEFNKLDEIEQLKAVEKGSKLSKILGAWCAAVRIENERPELPW